MQPLLAHELSYAPMHLPFPASFNEAGRTGLAWITGWKPVELQHRREFLQHSA